MSEADINVPDAQQDGGKSYAAQEQPKGGVKEAPQEQPKERVQEDADSDTARENDVQDGEKLIKQTTTGNDETDQLNNYEKSERKPEEQIKDDLKSANKDNANILSDEQDGKHDQTKKTKQSNMDNDLFIMSSGTDANAHDQTNNNINNYEHEKDDSDDENCNQQSEETAKNINHNQSSDNIKQGDIAVNDNHSDTTVNNKREQNTINSEQDHDSTVDSIFNEPTENVNSKKDMSDKVDITTKKDDVKGDNGDTERETAELVDIVDDDNEKEVMIEKSKETNNGSSNSIGQLSTSNDGKKDGSERGNYNSDLKINEADNDTSKERVQNDRIVDSDDSTISDKKNQKEPPLIEQFVASPQKEEAKLAQSSESPEARASTKQHNELEWEKISQDEEPVSQDEKLVSKTTDFDSRSIDTRETESSKRIDNVQYDRSDDDVKSEVSITLSRENNEKGSNEQIREDEPNQSARSEDEKHVVIAPEVRITSAKDKNTTSPNSKGRQSKSPGPQTRTPTPNAKSPRPQYSRNSGTFSPYRRTQEERKFRRPIHSAPATSKSGINRPKSDGRRCISRASTDGRQKKDYKAEELRRIREVLRKEKSTMKKPATREYVPFTWNSLDPYFSTSTAAFLIELPAEFRYKYVSRNTAHGMVDPEVDLRMDHEILPKIGSAQRTSTRGLYSLENPSMQRKSRESKKDKKEFGGSTRLPKFPVVPFHAGKENATQRFPYQDIPKFRQEMDQRFSLHAPKKIDQDYKRTKDDFYRMELDKLEQIHPLNRPHMRKAYFAYLQNTPGSKKAISECVKSLDGPPREHETRSAQEAN